MDRPDVVADTILAVATQTRAAAADKTGADEDSPAQNRKSSCLPVSRTVPLAPASMTITLRERGGYRHRA